MFRQLEGAFQNGLGSKFLFLEFSVIQVPTRYRAW
jgi:hypothetical protein